MIDEDKYMGKIRFAIVGSGLITYRALKLRG